MISKIISFLKSIFKDEDDISQEEWEEGIKIRNAEWKKLEDKYYTDPGFRNYVNRQSKN